MWIFGPFVDLLVERWSADLVGNKVPRPLLLLAGRFAGVGGGLVEDRRMEQLRFDGAFQRGGGGGVLREDGEMAASFLWKRLMDPAASC